MNAIICDRCGKVLPTSQTTGDLHSKAFIITIAEAGYALNGKRGPKGDRERYSWARNPWVFVYTFEPISKKEAEMQPKLMSASTRVEGAEHQ